jgi:dephospho-CoA kinase
VHRQVTVIGVTGSFGTGKTIVSRFFHEFGAIVLDADKIAHEALLAKNKTYNKIVKIFGERVLKKNGRIDRSRLGKVVFNNAALLKRLCAIVHPYVIKRISHDLKRIKARNPGATIILDIPLLIEADLLDLVDKLIVVKLDIKKQIERWKKRTGLARDEVLRRIGAQMPMVKKVRFSDFVIDNSGTKGQTKRKVKRIWEQIQQQAIQKKRI